MSPEQLLALADIFTAEYPARVRSYSALVAAASVTTARLHGVAVLTSRTHTSAALAETLRRLEPLTSSNAEFAAFCARVYERRAAGEGDF